MKRFWPLLLFMALAVLLAIGLTLKPREIPSPLVGKPAPAFTLLRLDAAGQTFSPANLRGKVWLLNVWASWCSACVQEHVQLLQWAGRKSVVLVGLNYKDEDDAARRWLQQQGGNPYAIIAADQDGRVGIDYGVYGVPETFVIDRAGLIRYKHIGPLNAQVLADKIEPLLRELQQ
ncbi:DsbE family thiol:disulfide interchange protein [Chitinibacter tainanensis]|uniref:DsbE family thiol:disulfide interchange protein n=1 Tax=Chitinibacter tainanensis TaxID=230667 RepID=UPI002353B818|nr:DsbE family thiol:disulfide interchange protein [Chitinibacter tainanensis]